jgi:KDO transferase-3
MVRQVIQSGAACFFSGEGIGHICERDPTLLSHGRIYLSEVVNRRWGVPRLTAATFDEAAGGDPDMELHPTVRPQNGLVGFSRDLRKGLFCGRTIGYRAIQIGYFLGLRRVFLLGMDLGSQGQRVRFYELLAEGRPSLLEQDFAPYILPCFEIVRRLQSAGELEVFNCSTTSRLPPEVTPRLSFEDARAMCLAMQSAA